MFKWLQKQYMVVYLVALLAIVFGAVLPVSISSAGDSTAVDRYEYYESGGDGFSSIAGTSWLGQSFTTTGAYNITMVRLYVKKVGGGTTGALTASIRACNATGYPTGNDLCSGSVAQADLPTSYAWVNVTLDSGAILSATTQYAIVARAPDASDADVYWHLDSTSPTYTGGVHVNSVDSGVNFTLYSTLDNYFENWGQEIPPPPLIPTWVQLCIIFGYSLTVLVAVFIVGLKGNIIIAGVAAIIGVIGFIVLKLILGAF